MQPTSPSSLTTVQIDPYSPPRHLVISDQTKSLSSISLIHRKSHPRLQLFMSSNNLPSNSTPQQQKTRTTEVRKWSAAAQQSASSPSPSSSSSANSPASCSSHDRSCRPSPSTRLMPFRALPRPAASCSTTASGNRRRQRERATTGV